MAKVSIVGRPNVGKSTLFNRIIGGRKAIVEDIPAVTRDRLEMPANWLNRNFTLIDTGGIIFDENESISVRVRKQAEKAILESDVIIFCVDVLSGIVPLDIQIADFLRRSSKPIILVVNKSDNITTDKEFGEFYSLGLGEPFMISAMHGRAIDEILDKVIKNIPEDNIIIKKEAVKIAIIGRPNVGKSTLFNIFAGDERSIVHNVAGTTRDAIDTPVTVNKKDYILIDTAGIRRKSKIYDKVEEYSVNRALKAIERADIVLFLVEPNELIKNQDMKLIGYIKKNYKPCIVVVNKWDLVEKSNNTMVKTEKEVRYTLNFAPYVPIIFISALKNKRTHFLFKQIEKITDDLNISISTSELNAIFQDAVSTNPPPIKNGNRFKILYLNQIKKNPPTFNVFCNNKKHLHFSYIRYLENHFRNLYPFIGIPLRFLFKSRRKD